jgi:hypothetical protein
MAGWPWRTRMMRNFTAMPFPRACGDAASRKAVFEMTFGKRPASKSL